MILLNRSQKDSFRFEL